MKKILASLLLVVTLLPVSALAKGDLTGPGDFFPQYSFVTMLSSGDAAYLGVAAQMKQSGRFEVVDVWGDILVLELFNRYCYGCQLEAPIMNSAYNMVASDPILSMSVRFMGVGVGNNSRMVSEYRKEFSVPFPLVPDPRFGIFEALGNPGGTPYTIILKRTPMGMMVVSTHFSGHSSAEELVDEIRTIHESDVDQLLADAEPVQRAQWIEKGLKLPLTEDELENRVMQSMGRAGYGKVGLYAVDLPGGERVYVGESKRGKVFSRIVSKLPLCDVCHPIHYILTFNTKGQIVDFDTIYVTKYWNVEWNPDETQKMRKRLMGMSVLEERTFDPDVDAVSTATMSSTLIFDSVGRTGEIYRQLRELGQY